MLPVPATPPGPQTALRAWDPSPYCVPHQRVKNLLGQELNLGHFVQNTRKMVFSTAESLRGKMIYCEERNTPKNVVPPLLRVVHGGRGGQPFCLLLELEREKGNEESLENSKR